MPTMRLGLVEAGVLAGSGPSASVARSPGPCVSAIAVLLLRFAVAASTFVAARRVAQEQLSTLHPAGPAAADHRRRCGGSCWSAPTLIFLLVMALLALAFRRGRAARDGPDDRRERVWIDGMGHRLPRSRSSRRSSAYGLVVGERLLPRPAPDVVTVAAEGRQWAWRFTYADAPGRATEGVLHIPAGRPVDVAITSADVIHSFWVPRLAGKLDAIPGHVNVLRIEADAPGDYAGVSAEFNGPGYRSHRFAVDRARPGRLGGVPRRRRAMNALRRHRALTRIWASDPGWKGWFTTVNHNDLGRMFLVAARCLLRDRRHPRHADPGAARDARARPSWGPRSTTRSSRCTGPS